MVVKIRGLSAINKRYITIIKERKSVEVPTYRGAFVEHERKFKNIFSSLLSSFDKAVQQKKESHKGTVLFLIILTVVL